MSLLHVALRALLEVHFPLRVVWIGSSLDFDVPPYRDAADVNQLYNFSFLSRRRECPSGSRRRPVTTCDPTTALVGMTALRPLPQSPPDLPTQPMEGFPGNCAAMIVCPAANQRIEHPYQGRLRQMLLFLHQHSDFPLEGLYAFLRRPYQHAVAEPTHVPSEEVEPLLDMRDVGFLG